MVYIFDIILEIKNNKIKLKNLWNFLLKKLTGNVNVTGDDEYELIAFDTDINSCLVYKHSICRNKRDIIFMERIVDINTLELFIEKAELEKNIDDFNFYNILGYVLIVNKTFHVNEELEKRMKKNNIKIILEDEIINSINK